MISVRRGSWIRYRRAILGAAIAGAVLGMGTATALSGHQNAWHTGAYWENGLRSDSYENGHPFLDSVDGACRDSSVAFVYKRTGWHSNNREGIYCHNHMVSPYTFDDTSAHVGSSQTGMSHHAHP